MSIKLAIFDMDGTTLSTLEDISNAVNHTLQEFGQPTRPNTEIVNYLGNGSRWLWENIFPGNDELIDKYLAAYSAYYKEHCTIHTKPYDGILDLLMNLRNQGIKVAIVSNKPDFAVQPLCQEHFSGLIDFACGERQGIRRKPYPDSVNECLNKLKIDRAEAVYIGDSEVDVATAKNSGLECLAVSWGFRSVETLKKAGAKKIFATVEELEKEILHTNS